MTFVVSDTTRMVCPSLRVTILFCGCGDVRGAAVRRWYFPNWYAQTIAKTDTDTRAIRPKRDPSDFNGFLLFARGKGPHFAMHSAQRRTLITISATLDNSLSPRMPFSSGAVVLLPRTKVTGMAAIDAINTQWGTGTVRYAAVGLRPRWIMRCA